MKHVCALTLCSAVALVLMTGHGFAQTQYEPTPWGPSDKPATAPAKKPMGSMGSMSSQAEAKPAAKKPMTGSTMAAKPTGSMGAMSSQAEANPAAKKPMTAGTMAAKPDQAMANMAAKQEAAADAQDEPGPLRRLWNRVVASADAPDSPASPGSRSFADVFSTKDGQ